MALTEASHVVLSVYDILGRKVATLADEVLSPGRSVFEFDGSALGAGIYFCDAVAQPLSSPSRATRDVQKLVILR